MREKNDEPRPDQANATADASAVRPNSITMSLGSPTGGEGKIIKVLYYASTLPMVRRERSRIKTTNTNPLRGVLAKNKGAIAEMIPRELRVLPVTDSRSALRIIPA